MGNRVSGRHLLGALTLVGLAACSGKSETTKHSADSASSARGSDGTADGALSGSTNGGTATGNGSSAATTSARAASASSSGGEATDTTAVGSGGAATGVGGASMSGGAAGETGATDSTTTGGCNCHPTDLECNLNCTDPMNSGDCASDKSCVEGHCVELSPGGYRVCAPGTIEVTSCANPDDQPPDNECCDASDCPSGSCVEGPLTKSCGGPRILPYNVCAEDECASSADCAGLPNGVCFPAGAYGHPVATCVAGSCQKDSDCNEEPGGACVLVSEDCCGTRSLACVYPGGCRTLADCPASAQSCLVVDGRAVCSSEPLLCPA